MKKIMQTLAAAFAALAFSSTLFALPPGPGSQHVRFTGEENFLALAPDYSTFITQHTISIPSLQVDEYVLILDMTTTVLEWLGDGYYMCGKGPIMSPDGLDVVGEISFVARTHVLEFTVLQPWTINVSLAGVIWDGPLAGLVVTENINGSGTSNPWFYEARVDGFFMVPEFVDMEALKASLAEAEKSLILASLRRNEGDKKITAAELGISLKTLYNRLREYESQASP